MENTSVRSTVLSMQWEIASVSPASAWGVQWTLCIVQCYLVQYPKQNRDRKSGREQLDEQPDNSILCASISLGRLKDYGLIEQVLICRLELQLLQFPHLHLFCIFYISCIQIWLSGNFCNSHITCHSTAAILIRNLTPVLNLPFISND